MSTNDGNVGGKTNPKSVLVQSGQVRGRRKPKYWFKVGEKDISDEQTFQSRSTGRDTLRFR